MKRATFAAGVRDLLNNRLCIRRFMTSGKLGLILAF